MNALERKLHGGKMVDPQAKIDDSDSFMLISRHFLQTSDPPAVLQ
jgi:hypothetical protein